VADGRRVSLRQELSYAEVKAIASGNPAVLTLAEADAELQRLALLRKNHLDEQYVARRNVRDLPGRIARFSERLAGLDADRATVTAHAGDDIVIGERAYPREDAMAVLGKRLEALPQAVREEQRVPLGTYRGLRFGLVLCPHFPPEVYLEGAATRTDRLTRGSHGARAVLNALDRLCAGYDTDISRLRQDLSIAESQLRDYQARVGRPFVHESYQDELTALRDRLKASLAGMTTESTAGTPAATAAELAERIKALKAAHTVEAPAARAATRRLDAEEPVTTRIRRQAVARCEDAAPSHEPDAFAIPGLNAPGAGVPQRAPKQYREHVADQRRRAHRLPADTSLQR